MLPWSLILKRLRRKPFTADELRRSVQFLVDDISWVRRSAPQLATEFENAKFADGQSFHSVWKAGLHYITERVARQPTWVAQRTELLRLCVNAASWIAAANAILPEYEDDPDAWRDIVSEASVFKNNPQERWADVLRGESVQNQFNLAIMLTMSASCFVVPLDYNGTIDTFRNLKKRSDETRVCIIRDVHIMATDAPYENWYLINRFKSLVLPNWKSTDAFFRRMGEDIAQMRTISAYGEEWERLANSHNEQMQRILSELRASTETDLN